MDLNTYLFFDGQCEAAFRLYNCVLGGDLTLMRYADVPSGPPAFATSDRTIHACLSIGGRLLMGSDTPPAGVPAMGGEAGSGDFKTPQGFRANVSAETPAEAERIWSGLTEGGSIASPLGETFFAHRFGMFTDRFGTPWMITCPKQTESCKADTKPFTIARTLDAPRDIVWTCFTDPRRMQQWWGPKGVTITASRMDLRPGGTYHYGMRTPDGKEMWGRQVYLEIEPPARLVFINSFSDEQGGLARHPLGPGWPIQMHSTLTLVELAPGKTVFSITWRPFAPTAQEQATFDAGHDSMRQGWTGTLDQLAAYLAKA